MAEGKLRCAGSSLFLKKNYGVGYQLTIEKNNLGATHSKLSTLVEMTDDEGESCRNGSANLGLLIESSVPQAKLLNDVGTEIRYQLPLGASDKFATMFELLDAEVDLGHIVSYGVSMTTLGKCHNESTSCLR
jgi:ATP-binding cassette, subfamily A (ABC1), member 3